MTDPAKAPQAAQYSTGFANPPNCGPIRSGDPRPHQANVDAPSNYATAYSAGPKRNRSRQTKVSHWAVAKPKS